MIDWGALLSVAGTTLVATVVLVFVVSWAARLLEDGVERVAAGQAVGHLRLGAVLLISLAAVAVLFGLWLIIPWLH